MYSPWRSPSLALKKILGMRNPMVYQYVNHKMLISVSELEWNQCIQGLTMMECLQGGNCTWLERVELG
eukprot:5440839-Amphidinium_carterae.1